MAPILPSTTDSFHSSLSKPENGPPVQTARLPVAPDFDPRDPGFQADPYPTLARLRREAPVLPLRAPNGFPCCYVFRHADVAAALRDPRLSTVKIPPELLDRFATDPASPLHRLARLMRANLLLLEPPEHTRLRTLVSRAFTPRRVAALRPRIEALAEELADGLAERETPDLLADFAVPLPLRVIAELLGLPAGDLPRLRAWSGVLVTLLDGSLRDASLGECMRVAEELGLYLEERAAERRRSPRDDLLGALVAARDERDALDDDELVSTVGLLLAAGHETTANLIGNGVVALLRHPEALEELRARPALLPSAVEELLRFDPPVQLTSRLATEDLEIAGVRIPQGVELELHLASANRDAEVFSDPDALDLGRGDPRHLSFGHGHHFCLGAALARLEAEVALGALLRRFPELALRDEPLVWRPGNVLRGLVRLPVALPWGGRGAARGAVGKPTSSG